MHRQNSDGNVRRDAQGNAERSDRRRAEGEGTSAIFRSNRHRGTGRPASPATPPYMRVRIRRFGGLS
jgi:hypothetical protein